MNSRSGRGKNNAHDPVLELVVALMDENPNGWNGTAEEMLTEGAELIEGFAITRPADIGLRLPKIQADLEKQGIHWGKKRDNKRRTHYFTRNENISLLSGEI